MADVILEFPKKTPRAAINTQTPATRGVGNMKEINPVTAAFLNRQYRKTFRSIMQGLLASGSTLQSTELIARVHELTVATLGQFQKVEF